MGAAVLALYGIYIVGVSLAGQLEAYRGQTRVAGDPIGGYERRFLPLKSALPGHGVVGYLTDADQPGEKERALFLAQYALAPLVVSPDDRPFPLVIGNFHRSLPGQDLLAREGLRLVAYYGNGVVLFRRDEGVRR